MIERKCRPFFFYFVFARLNEVLFILEVKICIRHRKWIHQKLSIFRIVRYTSIWYINDISLVSLVKFIFSFSVLSRSLYVCVCVCICVINLNLVGISRTILQIGQSWHEQKKIQQKHKISYICFQLSTGYIEIADGSTFFSFWPAFSTFFWCGNISSSNLSFLVFLFLWMSCTIYFDCLNWVRKFISFVKKKRFQLDFANDSLWSRSLV